MISVAEINDIEQLKLLRLLWRDLLNKTKQASFFGSLDWLECYWRHAGTDRELRVLMTTLAGQPIGIVPLVLEDVQTRLGSMRVLSYPLDCLRTVGGSIGPHPAATMLSVMRYLSHSRRDWDVIDLGGVDVDGTDHRRTQNAMRNSGLNAFQKPDGSVAAVELNAVELNVVEHNLVRPHFSVRSSRRMPDRPRDLQTDWIGSECIEYVRHRPQAALFGDGDPRWDLFEVFRSLPQTIRSLATGPIGSSDKEQEADFFADLHETAAACGTVDLNVLYFDGRPVAGASNVHFDSRVEEIEFRISETAPPQAEDLLIERMLKDSVWRGDLLHTFASAEAGASRWATRLQTRFRYTHYSRMKPRAQLLRLSQHVSGWFSSSVDAPQDRIDDDANDSGVRAPLPKTAGASNFSIHG